VHNATVRSGGAGSTAQWQTWLEAGQHSLYAAASASTTAWPRGLASPGCSGTLVPRSNTRDNQAETQVYEEHHSDRGRETALPQPTCCALLSVKDSVVAAPLLTVTCVSIWQHSRMASLTTEEVSATRMIPVGWHSPLLGCCTSAPTKQQLSGQHRRMASLAQEEVSTTRMIPVGWHSPLLGCCATLLAAPTKQ
jgi:hypothetical protein